ncbi:hypothetical protein [Halorarum salinum]|uniref:DUF885 domain-containing protein n=1 Tax=Halorarum salinum TaxID=2743089 RepID=A0A7D5L9C1_9EURY|nr:hypothetical protein [Halobaculum salinum]QLG61386.1 hypothetical protein HUG12_06410 [Halobaculum salinum]
MSRRYTRRTALALLGGVTLAGCSGGGRDRYWADPPAFDRSGLGAVTDDPVPDRPEPLPVSVPDERLAGFTERVDELLAPIPRPLTADALPNGEMREAIRSERRDARTALDRMDAAAGTLPTVAAGADACERAATAAGVWAAISTTRELENVTESTARVLNRVDDLETDLPDAAAGPAEAAVVYGEPEEWLAVARRDTLVGRPAAAERANPLRMGRVTGQVERIRVELETAVLLRDRYVEGLDQPRSVEEALTEAVAALGPETERRLRRLHGEDAGRLHVAPGSDDLLERDAPRDAPGVRLLSEKVYDAFDEIRFGPIAWPDADATHPALTVRKTHWTFATLDAVESVRDRVDDGEDLFPPDAAAIEETRAAAIDAVADLVASGSPLERWTAWRLVPAFEGPDGVLGSGSEPDRREIAGAYGEYVWIEAVTRATPDATRVVDDALA